MTHEQIENIAENYAYNECVNNETENQSLIRFVSRNGFIKGAKWRIESVWYENTMKPNKDCHVLLEDIFGNIYDDEYCAVYDEFDSSIEWKEIKRWAYIKDLLPEE